MTAIQFRYGANFQVIGKTDPQKLSYAGAFKPVEGTFSDLAGHIGKGHPWMSALLDGNGKRWQINANHAEVLAADIDGGLTIEQAIAHPFIAAYCGLGVESASSRPDHEKFRVVHKLTEAIGHDGEGNCILLSHSIRERLDSARRQSNVEPRGRTTTTQWSNEASCLGEADGRSGESGKNPDQRWPSNCRCGGESGEGGTDGGKIRVALPTGGICEIAVTEAEKAQAERFRHYKAWQVIKACNRHLIHLLKVADPACKDASRFFFGAPGRKPFLLNEAASLPESFVNDAISWAEAEELELQRQAERAREKYNQWRANHPERDPKALILDALDYIHPDCDYNDWLAIGMTLFAELGAEGLIAWDSWSSKGSKYEPGLCDRKARSFGRCESRLGHFFHLAKLSGFKFPKRSLSQTALNWGELDRQSYEQYRRDVADRERVEEAQSNHSRLQSFKSLLLKGVKRAVKGLGVKQGFVSSQPVDRGTWNYTPGSLLSGYTGEVLVTPEQLPDLIAEARQKGYTDILDISPTGTGKSHTWGSVTNSQWRLAEGAKLWYLSRDHRNPSTGPVEDEFTDLPVRNTGFVVDPDRLTPSGKPHLRHPKKGEQPTTAGNCHLASVFHTAASKGVSLALESSANNPICQACQHNSYCGQGNGNGYSGFRGDRRDVLKNESRIRAALESLPSVEDRNYSHDIAILEEAGQNLKPTDRMQVTLADFDRQWAELDAELPDQADLLSPVRRKLRSLIGGSHSSYHGLNDAELREMLGEFPEGVNLSDIERILAPVFEEEEPDLIETAEIKSEIEALKNATRGRKNSVLKQRLDFLYDAKRTIHSLNRDSHRQAKKSLREKVESLPNQWLPKFLRVWQTGEGALRIGPHGDLFITEVRDRNNEILDQMALRVHLDASLAQERLKLLRQQPDMKLLTIELVQPEQVAGNLDFIWVTGFGLAGKQRAESTDQRLETFITHLKELHPDLAVFDHQAKRAVLGADGWHFGNDTRGSNRFKERSAIASIGLPLPDVGSTYDEWLALGGESLGLDFDDYYRQLVDAELIQEAGRLRANRRPGETLTFYLIADTDRCKFDYTPPAELNPRQVDIVDLCPEAAAAGKRLVHLAKVAGMEILKAGQKVTQQAIAQAIGVTQGRISQIFAEIGGWKGFLELLEILLKTPYRKSNNPSEEYNQWQRESVDYLVTVASAPPWEVPRHLLKAIDTWGRQKFIEIVAAIPLEARARLMGSLVTLLGDDDLSDLLEVTA